MNWHIRWGIRRDLKDMAMLDGTLFAEPWTEEKFVETLRQRNHISMVAESIIDDGFIDGFMVYELNKHSIRVVNYAVFPDVHREGLGTQMLDKLWGKLHWKRRRHLDFQPRRLKCGLSSRAISFFEKHEFSYLADRGVLRRSLGRVPISIPFDTNQLLEAFYGTPEATVRAFEQLLARQTARDVEMSARNNLNHMLSNGPIDPIPGGITRETIQQAMDIMRTR